MVCQVNRSHGHHRDHGGVAHRQREHCRGGGGIGGQDTYRGAKAFLGWGHVCCGVDFAGQKEGVWAQSNEIKRCCTKLGDCSQRKCTREMRKTQRIANSVTWAYQVWPNHNSYGCGPHNQRQITCPVFRNGQIGCGKTGLEVDCSPGPHHQHAGKQEGEVIGEGSLNNKNRTYQCNQGTDRERQTTANASCKTG